MGSNAHVPVLLGPVLEGLKIKPDGCYVDGTFGRGGHSREILKQLGSEGRLIAIDRDPQAIASAPSFLADDPRFELVKGCCAQLETIIGERGLVGKVDGLLFDLGVSSPQLDEADRGFSFMRDGPLDMRMDPDSGSSASEWLATVDERELKHVLRKFGEENSAARIARAIVSARKEAPISRTAQLARIVEDAAPKRGQKIHPATKTFQAIRIAVNDELEQLEAVLTQSVKVMRKGARLCVISFHSLEDRITKRFMRDASRETEQYRGMPNVPEEFQPKLRTIGKAIRANETEIELNRRARSAHLRVAERT
ncbi:MAG: 16S rRNA (cytosine(1402)-N(4))-methyltransferase RsmH [Gammaproteobacteria bacterium]|nr:16S rRNA (cytosine(1402)-N(4))-methyltransferase RsmH [Gammaproteobacteria bacterium]